MELVIVSDATSDDGGFYGSIPSLIVFVFKAVTICTLLGSEVKP